MFEFVRNNQRLVQLFLALIVLPFAFVGIDSFVGNSSSSVQIASVGDSRITASEFQNALREQGERMQQQMRERFDPKLLESVEVKRSVVNGMVNQRLLALAGKDSRLMVSDDALAAFIAQVPALQEEGKFSPARYEALVSSRGMTKEGFEARLRQDLAMQQLVQPLGEAAVVSKVSGQRWSSVQLEQRDVSELHLSAQSYLKQVKLDAGAEEKFFEANKSQFEQPEQIRVEYVILDRDVLAQQVSIVDADIEARYKAHPEMYTQAETRRASHILLTLAKDAKDEDLKKAQATAEQVLTQLKANPKSFGDLAKKHSQDPGSAQKGGDLDWFGRGMMVKPFEDAAFALKQDETSDVVRSDFGLHIIRVTGIRPEHVTPLADVRAAIAEEIKRETASRKFAEAAEGFNNMVYEQPDTLEPASTQWKLAVQKSDWLRKGDRLPAPFDHPKLQAAIFASEFAAKKQNTESIELAPGRLISARAVDSKPASLQAFDTVKPLITQRLMMERASELAIADGEGRLAKLQKGDAGDVKWGEVRQVLRAAPKGLPMEAAKQVFAANATKLPTYLGTKAAQEGGYTLYRVSGVTAAKADDPRAAMLAQQYERLVAEEEFGAWMASLKNRYKIAINDKAIDSKEP